MSTTFNTSGSYLTCTPAPTVAVSSPFAFACWINPSSLAVHQTPMSLQNGTDCVQIETDPGLGFYYAILFIGGTAYTMNFGAVSTGVWHHYACTWSGTQFDTYLDGVAGANTATTLTPVGNWTTLGIGGGGLGGPPTGVAGQMESAVVYTAYLSAAEIQRLYAQRRPAQRANLLAFYPLDAGAGRVRDFSGVGNDLTATGTPIDGTSNPPVSWGTGSHRYVSPASTGAIAAADVQTASLAAAGAIAGADVQTATFAAVIGTGSLLAADVETAALAAVGTALGAEVDAAALSAAAAASGAGIQKATFGAAASMVGAGAETAQMAAIAAMLAADVETANLAASSGGGGGGGLGNAWQMRRRPLPFMRRRMRW